MRVALAPGDFRRLAVALTVSQAGDWLYNVGLLVYIFERTHSPTWVAAGTIVRLLPIVLLAPLGGALADRYDRRKVMISSDLARAASMFALAVVASTSVTPALALALAFLSTLAGTPYRPAVAKTTPAVVPEKDLASANAAISAIANIAIIVGPAIGGLLLAVGPPSVGFAVNGVSFILGAAVVARIASLGQEKSPAVSSGGMKAQLVEGGRALGASGAIFIIAFVLAAEFVYGEMTVLLVLASERKLGTGAEGYGYLLAALGLGGVLIVGITGRLADRPRPGPPLAIGVIAACVPLSAIAFVAYPLLAFAIMVVAGGGAIITDVLSVTLLQRALSQDVLGRVFGIYDSLDVGSILAGALVAPILVSLFGLDTALIIAGAVVPVLPLLGLPAIRRLEGVAARRQAELAPTVDVLSRSGIFEDAPRASLELLAGRATTLDVAPGTVVIKQGEPALHLFVVISGHLDVEFAADPGVEPVTVNTLTDGDYFGEIGLLRHIPRTATVRAVTACKLLRIDGEDFLEVINQAPSMSGTLVRGISGRLARTHPSDQASTESGGGPPIRKVGPE